MLEANSVLSKLPFSLGLPAEAEPSPKTELLVMRAPFMYKVKSAHSRFALTRSICCACHIIFKQVEPMWRS